MPQRKGLRERDNVGGSYFKYLSQFVSNLIQNKEKPKRPFHYNMSVRLLFSCNLKLKVKPLFTFNNEQRLGKQQS